MYAWYVALLTSVACLVRWCVSLNYYSGSQRPPMYGDFEAQRHWMEITLNTQIKTWYSNTTDNDLLYWGLDYPPLTAYHSWLCGYIAHWINPRWVALHASRGFESYHHKLFMRYTVLVADLLVYIPAVLVYCWTCVPTLNTKSQKLSQAFLTLLYPGLILIDHGHFQYNCISLGLTIWAVIGLSRGYNILGAVAFCLALNYKQMSLYHALPFFCYLLGGCLQLPIHRGLIKLICLAAVVIATFAMCWLPYLDGIDSTLQVFHRLFPLARGLYEDKVANVWCSLSVIIKLKQLFTVDQLVLLCIGTTLAMLVPSSLHLLLNPSKKHFKLALVNSSLVFFLFSFQVHEKSILLAALPVCLLQNDHPRASTWFLVLSTFSMFPLLLKDGLLIPFIALTLLYVVLVASCFDQTISFRDRKDTLSSIVFTASLIGCAILSVAMFTVSPPSYLPDLWPVLISLYSCGHFLCFTLYYHWCQMSVRSKETGREKKSN